MTTPNIKSFSKGEYIFREASEGHYAYFITKGEVEISTEREGKKVVLERVTAGRCFGEMGPILNTKRAGTAVALEYTEAYVIDAAFLEKLLQESNPLLRTMAYALISRVKRMTETFAAGRLTRSPLVAVARVLELLARIEHLRTREHLPAHTVTLSYRNTAKTIAEAIGQADHVADSLLRKMADLGLVQFDGLGDYRTIRLSDEGLQERTQSIVRATGDALDSQIQAENLLVSVEELSAELGMEAAEIAERMLSSQHLLHQILVRREDVLGLLQGGKGEAEG